MRILMLSHGYPPTVSGVTLVVQKLARSLVNRDHEVIVITASEHGEPYRTTDQGMKLIRVRSWRNPFWREGPIPITLSSYLQQEITEYQPDIIHSHENALMFHQLIRKKNELPCPLVVSCYFFPCFVTHYVRLGSGFDRRLEAWLWRHYVHTFNQADTMVFSTHVQRDEYVKHGLKTNAAVISNGVNLSSYYPRDGNVNPIENRYKLPQGPRLLFNGRLARDKRIDILIRAMPELWEEFNAHLLQVGRGEDRPRLQGLAKKLNLDHCIHFLGFVPEEDLPVLYRSADVFSIASVCEVQSIPVLKALASGLPVIAANAAALPEIVHDGINGRLVPPNDPTSIAEAVSRILRDPDEAYKFGKASLEIIQAHAEANTFHAYEQLYLGLVR